MSAESLVGDLDTVRFPPTYYLSHHTRTDSPRYLTPDWAYTNNHNALPEPLLVVSPFSSVLLTDNAELIRQIAQRREHFPKDVESYAVLKQFGENVLTSEGATWKLHRRVTNAAFGEKNAALVFEVASEQTKGLIEKWMADQTSGTADKGSRPVSTIDRDTMKLALNIIGYVGFGLRLLWPGQKLPDGTDPRLYKYTTLEPTDGHTMSFVEAVAGMLDTLLLLLIVPEWLLRKSLELASPLRSLY